MAATRALVSSNRSLDCSPANQRKALGVLYGLDRKINIEVWPVQVIGVK